MKEPQEWNGQMLIDHDDQKMPARPKDDNDDSSWMLQDPDFVAKQRAIWEHLQQQQDKRMPQAAERKKPPPSQPSSTTTTSSSSSRAPTWQQGLNHQQAIWDTIQRRRESKQPKEAPTTTILKKPPPPRRSLTASTRTMSSSRTSSTTTSSHRPTTAVLLRDSHNSMSRDVDVDDRSMQQSPTSPLDVVTETKQALKASAAASMRMPRLPGCFAVSGSNAQHHTVQDKVKRMQAPNDPRRPSKTKHQQPIMSIRGTHHVVQAIHQGTAQLVACSSCHALLQVPRTTKHLYCTLCGQVTPLMLEDHDPQTKNDDTTVVYDDEALARALQRQELASYHLG